MKKCVFGVIKIRKWMMNFSVSFIIALVGGVALISGLGAVSTSVVNGVYYAGNKNSNNVSLMVNVYWGNEYLESMLDTFKEQGVKTTFFLGGTWVVANENLLLRIKEDGHEIASHGYAHKDYDKLNEEENFKQISNTHKIVKELADVEMNLFAPPSGAYSKATVNAANRLCYKTIMWSRDTIDWRDQDINLILKRATEKTVGGDLILMHPTKCTAQILPKILQALNDKGLVVTTVTNTLNGI